MKNSDYSCKAQTEDTQYLWSAMYKTLQQSLLFTKYRYVSLSSLLFAVFATISKVTPLSGDDWYWAVHGFERITSWTGYANARWAGNTIITFTTNFEWFRIVFEASVNTALVITIILILNFFGSKSLGKNAIIVMFTFCLMPIRVWRDTFFWSSGFANYNVSALLLLLILLIFLPYLAKRNLDSSFISRSPKLTVPIVLMLGFISQFFLETQTLFLLAFSVFLLIWSALHKYKITLPLSLLVGSAMGAIIMFSNPAYQTMFQGEQNLHTRTIGSNVIANFLENYSADGISIIFLSAPFIMMMLSFALVFTMRRTKLQQALGLFCLLFSFGTLFWTNMFRANFLGFPAVSLVAATASIFFIVAAFTCLLLQKEKSTNVYALLLLAAFVLALSVFIQGSYGPRNVFLPFILINIVSASLILSHKRIPTQVYSVMLTVVLAFAVVIGYGLYSNYQVAQSREKVIASAVQSQQDTIELELARFPVLGFQINPSCWSWENAMKGYYSIDLDVELVFVER